MKLVEARIGEAVADGSYPPRMVVVDSWNGIVVLGMIDHPEDTLADLMEAGKRFRASRTRDNSRQLDRRRRLGQNKD